ncbi:MAG: ECF transporter S component [Candidatus Cloacimonetes bacterium]|nr:ECF transporter S component [Candidatus Cloacimonadota bacterium]
MSRWLSKFSTQDLIIIAIIAALGLAVKPVITPIVHLVSAPLLIPGGSLAGGFYMLWFGLIVVLVPRKGSAILTAFVQGVVTLIIGHFGHHGVMSILIYTAPGVAVEVVALFFRDKSSVIAQTTICAGANLVGSLLVALLIMRLPTIPLAISLTTALISGIGGGIVSYAIIKQLKKHRFELLTRETEGDSD